MGRPNRATFAAYVVAVTLPFVLFAALQAAFSLRTARAEIEAAALAQSREIVEVVDGQLRADQGALEVLANASSIVSRDWPAATIRAAGVVHARPSWKTVIMTDIRTGRQVWQTGLPQGATPPARPWLAGVLNSVGPTVTGVVGAAPGCPCVAISIPVLEAGSPRYLLTAELSPQTFQDILLRLAPAHSTSAVVDRHGLFIARTMAYPAKLGTPATHYVRDAMARGRQGFYPGVTFEGLKNYTAFETSELTGWSAHIAVKADALTGPQLGSILLTGVAALAGLALALGIAAFGYRQSRLRSLQEARDAQAQKLAAVGQLAAGIAHDFNNLLMVISASLERISAKTENPDLRRPLENAKAASERGTNLIRQLMAFTRSEPLEIGPVDLVALAENLGGLVQEAVGRTVVVAFDIASDARWVTTSRAQLEMALLNLAVNARDAMPQGGRLDIRSRPAKGRPGFVDLEVTDTGEGMPKAVLDRAIEPFFTTKPQGKGTGLGLAQVFGVVSQSGGTVEIDSAPGAGTTITLRLKTAEAPTPAG